MAVDKSNDRVRRMFGEIAPRYDLLNHLLSMNVDRYWRWRVARMVPSGSGPVLDMCTGTGDLAFAFLDKAAAGTEIVGADFCHEMLAIGRQKAAKRNVSDRVRFVEADAQNLPFEDDTFSLVSVAFGLRNVADTSRGLAEMARVCAPGGRIAILEFALPRHQPLRGLYRWYFNTILPRIGQALARNSSDAYNYLPTSVGEFDARQKLVERIEATGMQDVTWHDFTFGIATLYIGVKPSGEKAETESPATAGASV